MLLLSQQLKSGESYTQPVAIGKRPKEGKDAQFIPLVADPRDRVLKPQASGPNGKVDMRDLGAVVTVGENEQVMRRIPAKPGENGYTVTGAIIPPRPVKDLPLKPGAGTAFRQTILIRYSLPCQECLLLKHQALKLMKRFV